MSIIVATLRPKKISEFLIGLAEASQMEVEVETTGAGALERVKAEKPELVIIDEGLPDFEPLQLVVEIMMVSAMTNTAVVTSMSEDEFHEASEGYGVLKGLPVNPTNEDGQELARLLEEI